LAIIEAFIKHLLNKATVVYKSKLTKAVYHIRIQSESIKDTEFVPGYFLRVSVGLDNNDLSIKDKIRSYSVWNINKNQGIITWLLLPKGKGLVRKG
jgi:NAD(P)H-flavin reductase